MRVSKPACALTVRSRRRVVRSFLTRVICYVRMSRMGYDRRRLPATEETKGAVKPVPPLTSYAVGEQQTVQNARLEDLLQRYGSLLRRTIARACPPELGLSCEDVEQEARISLWKALDSEREIAFPVSYIYKVGISAAYRAIRRVRARREQPLEVEGDETSPVRSLSAPPHASPDKVAERREWVRKIEQALTQLPENRRLAVELHLQDLTTAQIGQILGWTEPKARNLLYRGLKDLRKALRTIGIEYQP